MGDLVSIIICTFNHAESLNATLKSIAGLEIPSGIDVEVVVVDNGSTDHTCDVVRNVGPSPMEIRYFVEPRQGLSHARNTALTHARGDIFLWTDDDVTVPPSWISAMTAPLLSGEFQGAGGRVKMNPSLERPWMNRSHCVRLADTRYLSDDNPAMFGANMAFTRDVLKTVPAFDVELGAGQGPAGEDTLFFSQMLVAGFKIAPVPACIVEHNFDPSRLAYKYWIKSAIHTGLCAAYLNHHWRHEEVDKPALRELLWKSALTVLRTAQRRKSDLEEGCLRLELRAVDNIACYRSMRSLEGTPRSYDRLGLVKREG